MKTFEMIMASLSLQDKLEKIQLFQENFLLANINPKVELEMFFVTLSSTNIWFIEKNLE